MEFPVIVHDLERLAEPRLVHAPDRRLGDEQHHEQFVPVGFDRETRLQSTPPGWSSFFGSSSLPTVTLSDGRPARVASTWVGFVSSFERSRVGGSQGNQLLSAR